jgi:hypothetical protein
VYRHHWRHHGYRHVRRVRRRHTTG